MSDRHRPVDSRTWAQILSAVLVLILLIGVITQLRRTHPGAPLDLGIDVPSVSSGDVNQSDVACQRRGPEDVAPRATGTLDRVTSTQVTACPTRYDQRSVTFVGEVIGDVLEREGGAWLLMNDDAYALQVGPLPAHQEFSGGNTGLAVWLPERYVGLIDAAGGPDTRGTVLRVRGMIHRADPADGGGLTLRADEAELLAEAATIPHPLHTSQVVVALIAALAAIATVVAERRVAYTR